MLGWLRRIRRTADDLPAIEFDHVGVRLVRRGVVSESFEWRRLDAVCAWQVDTWVDTLVVRFELMERGTFVCMNDRMPGFKELMAEVERRCAGFEPDWRHSVMFPAFAENYTVLWKRRASDRLE